MKRLAQFKSGKQRIAFNDNIIIRENDNKQTDLFFRSGPQYMQRDWQIQGDFDTVCNEINAAIQGKEKGEQTCAKETSSQK